MTMRILAMYLPQFHRVKENDEWWGEGFTDWIPTRDARPLCEGHYQPHIPLNGNFYDLMNKDTMLWQAELMHKYGIDGMCIYHYYFKDGRKILEKPAELLLDNKEIDMPFCFYWANESWKRSWSNVPNANIWHVDSEKKPKPGEDGLLLNQQYGNEEDWIAHFDYMLPFFKDNRYIRVDTKPLLIIYRTSLIPCLEPMVACFREQAKRNGFSDLYIIGAYANKTALKCLDGFLYHEPPQTLVSFRESGKGDSAYSITYDELTNSVLGEAIMPGVKTYFSCFTGFDDTPRRSVRGNALIDATPDKFRTFLSKTMAKNQIAGNDITFINAWNEWGEGMHLEPDEKYGYAFLEAAKAARELYPNYIDVLKDKMSSSTQGEYSHLQDRADKFGYYYRVMDRWMELREKGISICDYFCNNNIARLAIYGYGDFARHLRWELEENGIKVQYVIDRQGNNIDVDLPVILPDDNLPECDAIIVTTFWIFDEIRNKLGSDKRLIPLDEIIMLEFQDK